MKSIKKVSLGIIAVVGIISIVAFIYYRSNYISNKKFREAVNITEDGFEYKDTETNNDIVVRSKTEVYNDIHHMANTKIVADKIWKKEEITEEKLNKVILEVMKSNFSDKDRLLEMLHNWKNGDFSNCVNEHNYVWTKLGGTVGKATGLKKGVAENSN